MVFDILLFVTCRQICGQQDALDCEKQQEGVHHFIDCIRSGEKPLSSGVEGLEVVRVLEGAAMSLTNKGCNILFNWEDEGGNFLSLCRTAS